jgi:aspartyl protease family protein
MPAAPAYVRSVRLGSIAVSDVRALVMGSDTRKSVLGMSFLDKLEGYEVRGDRLILYPKR